MAKGLLPTLTAARWLVWLKLAKLVDGPLTLYHSMSARSFRPLWTIEELGLPCTLKMLPFPPRVHARRQHE
jgi:hypothetical protein